MRTPIAFSVPSHEQSLAVPATVSREVEDRQQQCQNPAGVMRQARVDGSTGGTRLGFNELESFVLVAAGAQAL
jgi:hypothetical protein